MTALEDQKTYTPCVAAIFGVTGLVGKELARMLLSKSHWKVYGVARKPENNTTTMTTIKQGPQFRFVSCDLLNAQETEEKLSPLMVNVTHIFWVTWAGGEFPLDISECCEQNKMMMANVLNAILPTAKALRHVSLQTGTKHYVSLERDDSSTNSSVINGSSYYDEESPRASTGNNFYYVLEDLLQERLPSYKVAWSVHRPGLIMGCSHRTLYNFIGSICVYGGICKYLNLPFVFGGTKECWEEMYLDASDARLVAEQHIWVATNNCEKSGQAFNAINGEGYTWKAIWAAIGAELDVYENSFSGDFMFSSAMGDKGCVWKEIVGKEGLVETEMKDLANWDFLDILFRCPAKILVSRNKVDSLGFKTTYNVLDSIIYWICVMRAGKLIP